MNWCVFDVLCTSSFVVETQPSMPQGRGPLVLRTNVQFSVKTRSVHRQPSPHLSLFGFEKNASVRYMILVWFSETFALMWPVRSMSSFTPNASQIFRLLRLNSKLIWRCQLTLHSNLVWTWLNDFVFPDSWLKSLNWTTLWTSVCRWTGEVNSLLCCWCPPVAVPAVAHALFLLHLRGAPPHMKGWVAVFLLLQVFSLDLGLQQASLLCIFQYGCVGQVPAF